MASLISQLRSGQQVQAQVQPQAQLNESVANIKQLMSSLMNMPNKQAVINNLIQQNPQLASLMKSQSGLEAYARSMAQARGIDIDQLIKQLNT